VVNVLLLTKRFEEAFLELSNMIEQLPQVTDKAAREQGLAVAALLYNQVGQYDLGLTYAEMIATQSAAGTGICRSGQFKIEALFKSGRLREVGREFHEAIDGCTKVGEVIRANVIRSYAARLYIVQERYADALRLLEEHYDEVQASRYSQSIAEFNSLLAQTHLKKGNLDLAKRYALTALKSAPKNEYAQQIVSAYFVLYTVAKLRGETKGALEYHEKYATADKAYLDDLSAGQVAYQRAKHEALANKSQIEKLNKQNEVLALQSSLADKAVEASRLYIIMLLMGLAFVAFMAYRTKRSQMHFKSLSRLDGLTGLFNRPHFLELAGSALDQSMQSGRPACVIICDLDYFKRINDTFGHAAGDIALKQTASAFQKHLRKQDIVGRLGGEEFAMVLIDCDTATALQRCDQIRLTIAAISIGDGAAAYKLSASLGVVSTTFAGHELRRLLADADAALYQAKLSGRNRVIQYSSSDIASDAVPAGNPAGLTA
jgi:diguanylate cyclase (GGDEF)-like protein